MKTLIATVATVALGACLLVPWGGLVFAGQPNQSCPLPLLIGYTNSIPAARKTKG